MRAQISTFVRLMGDHGMLEAIREALRRLDSGTKIRRSLFERRHGPGMLHSRRDWDNMVILDACRFDIFRDHSTLEGQLESMISVGDYTWEWMEQNWRGEFHDTILISANPFAERLPRNTFFKFVSVAESTGAIATDPAVVTEVAAEVARMHPDKRMIVHYMQPHTPHLGDVNDRFKQCGISGVDDRDEDDTYSVWEAVKKHLISRAELRESYIENLHIVEAQCERLCDLLEGKTVITSDHGEHLGERKPVFRYYGHGYDTIENRQVPYLIVPYETRKRLTQDEPQESRRRSEDEISDHLALLGYIE